MLPLFIALAALLVVVILFIIIFPKAYRKYLSKNYVKVYGKKIYHIALNEDFYLINQLKLKGQDESVLGVNHLLFGNKFIYVISDYYMTGEIEAKEDDQSWVFTPAKKGQKRYMDNLVHIGIAKAKKISQITNLDPSYFVAIALINNDLDITNFPSKIDNSKVSTLKNLRKLILSYESRKIGLLVNDQMKYTVKDIARLNIKEDKKHGK